MISKPRLALLVAAVLCSLPVVDSLYAAEAAPKAGQATQSIAGQTEEEEDAPTPAPLVVGTMVIASNPDLAIEAMAVDIAVDRITYSYRLRNKGKDKLALAASVAMPDLEVNSDSNSVYILPSQTPENPIGLAVRSNDQPVATTPHVEAVALGIDRQAEIRAAGFPLIPFGEATDKAIAAAKPEALSKLEALGVMTPRDPAQPDAPVVADWSLRVVQGWTQPLDPGAVTNVVVSFAPIKATYRVDAASLPGFDALKAQVCLTPAEMTAARALLKTKDAVLRVDDIVLANDGPARWLDNPAATVAVRKPQPNAVVAFCGMDAASAGKAVVTGKMPGSGEAAGLRVLVFAAAN